tara:strand:- start:63 stop:497 length:435 start_codon:yes stop_codon:yes gene_type:complete
VRKYDPSAIDPAPAFAQFERALERSSHPIEPPRGKRERAIDRCEGLITIVIEEQRQVVRAHASELENMGGKTCNLSSMRSRFVNCQGSDIAIMFAKVEVNRLDQLFDIGSNPPRSGCRKIVIEAKKLGMQHKAVMRPFREIHPF